MRPGSPQGRNLSLSSSSSSSSFTFPFSPGWVKRKVQRIMAVLSLCKKGMGTPVKCLAFCDNEEKSKSLFHSGIRTGTVHDHLKRMATVGGAARYLMPTPKVIWACARLNKTCSNNATCHIHQYTMKLFNTVTWFTLWKKKCACRFESKFWSCAVGSSQITNNYLCTCNLVFSLSWVNSGWGKNNHPVHWNSRHQCCLHPSRKLSKHWAKHCKRWYQGFSITLHCACLL